MSVVAGHDKTLVMLVTASDSNAPTVGALMDDWNLVTDGKPAKD